MNNDSIIFSEIYSFLNLLGNNYIDRLPSKLFNLIKEKKNNDYIPTYHSITDIHTSNIHQETISFIALLHLNYWCNSNKEKSELLTLFEKNEKKYPNDIYQKYNSNNIFINKKVNINIENNTPLPPIIHKQSIFSKFLHKLIHFFIE